MPLGIQAYLKNVKTMLGGLLTSLSGRMFYAGNFSLASRFESPTKTMKCELLVSETTRNAVGDTKDFKPQNRQMLEKK